MKQKNGGKLQSKVFRRYLASYLSVTLIMLSVLSVIMMKLIKQGRGIRYLQALFDALEFSGSTDIVCISDDLNQLPRNVIQSRQK